MVSRDQEVSPETVRTANRKRRRGAVSSNRKSGPNKEALNTAERPSHFATNGGDVHTLRSDLQGQPFTAPAATPLMMCFWQER